MPERRATCRVLALRVPDQRTASRESARRPAEATTPPGRDIWLALGWIGLRCFFPWYLHRVPGRLNKVACTVRGGEAWWLLPVVVPSLAAGRPADRDP